MRPEIKPKQRVKILHSDVEHSGEIDYGEIFSVNGDGTVTIKLDNGDEDHYFVVSFDWIEKDKQWEVDLR